MLTKTQDTMPKIRGVFSYKIYDKQHRIIDSYTDKNLIVDYSKRLMTRLIAGDGGTDGYVKYIGIGTNVSAVIPTDDTLSADAFYIALSDAITGNNTHNYYIDVDDPDTSSANISDTLVRFKWWVGYNQCVGMDISEFGLCDGTTSHKLFARKVLRGPIYKDADMAIDGLWTIQF